MDDYAGRILADRYRLPLPASDEYDFVESRAFDTYSGQEVLVRQVPLPEVVDAEMLDADDSFDGGLQPRPGHGAGSGPARRSGRSGRPGRSAATRRPSDPVVRRAVEAAQAAAAIPDHPRLDQVFDVFAEDGSLWIVGELVPARPLAAFLADRPMNPYRAAEVASDVLMALRVLHAHGWVHRNITARTVLVCDDGRVVLTGLASGAAEEALCGYDPVPPADVPDLEPGAGLPGSRAAEGSPGPGAAGPRVAGEAPGFGPASGAAGASLGPAGGATGSGPGHDAPRPGRDAPGPGPERGAAGLGPGPGGAEASVPGAPGSSAAMPGQPQGARPPGGPSARGVGSGADAEAARRAAIEARSGRLPEPGAPDRQSREDSAGIRAARAGAIAAYRAGARAAARVHEDPERGRPMLPGARPPAEGVEITKGVEGAGNGEDGQDAPSDASPGSSPGLSSDLPSDSLPDASSDKSAASPNGPSSASADAPSSALSNAASGPIPGRIADPYGVRGAPPWHGAVPRPGHGGAEALTPVDAPKDDRTPLPPAPRPGALPPGFRPGGAPAGSADNAPLPGGRPPRPSDGCPVTGRWDDLVAGTPAARRGPATALAAERARQARMTVVGAVTERWAPEQAVPVHDNWQLAAPVGPPTDLWALGALLFRSVQGHAPYPEESTAELVELVLSEPPAFAEECGPLRPVVESLLRQDPTERPDEEELSGWLRSLVRSAPEPEAGAHVVDAPPRDPRRLPIKRRKGELVRRKRRARASASSTHGRHKRSRAEPQQSPSQPRPRSRQQSQPPTWSQQPSGSGSPRRLGRVLLLLILLVLVGAFAYALLFMPKAGKGGDAQGTDRSSVVGEAGEVPSSSPEPDAGDGRSGGNGGAPSSGETSAKESNSPSGQAGSDGATPDGAGVADGFTLRNDPEGFQIAVPEGWSRAPRNGRGQVVYSHGNFEIIVVPGRDTTAKYGSDPMAYQRETEPELQPFRDSTWATSSGMRRVEVGQQVHAEGQFTWTDSQGRELFVRNLAILSGGHYHVVQVRGPDAELDEVTRIWEQASSTYRFGG